METVLIIIVTGMMCTFCFAIGAKVGQKVVKGEEIKMPNINPVEAVKWNEAKKKEDMEQARIDTIMRNIECFDGTGKGQEDVPRR